MNFSSILIPELWLWLAHLCYVGLIFWAISQLEWRHLLDAQDSQLLFASWLLLWLVWRQAVGITPGMEFHLLMVTSITLMFGWQYAIITVGVAQLALSVEGLSHWSAYSMNVLCNGAVPILVTYVVYRLKYVFMPKHFFVYIYIAAFFGGALSMLFSRLAGLSILLLSGAYTWLELNNEAVFIIIMLFPEAFLNGLIMTVLVAYKPHWVSSFNDDKYLKGK
jgi:uncharacterized membrane protein